MLLVEVEGTHTLQNIYDSLDIHLGQSYSVLVTADQPQQDYYIVVSTRFTSQVLTTTSILHYSNSAASVSGPPPGGPTIQIDWSLEQARSLRYLPLLLIPVYLLMHMIVSPDVCCFICFLKLDVWFCFYELCIHALQKIVRIHRFCLSSL